MLVWKRITNSPLSEKNSLHVTTGVSAPQHPEIIFLEVVMGTIYFYFLFLCNIRSIFGPNNLFFIYSIKNLGQIFIQYFIRSVANIRINRIYSIGFGDVIYSIFFKKYSRIRIFIRIIRIFYSMLYLKYSNICHKNDNIR